MAASSTSSSSPRCGPRRSPRPRPPRPVGPAERSSSRCPPTRRATTCVRSSAATASRRRTVQARGRRGRRGIAGVAAELVAAALADGASAVARDATERQWFVEAFAAPPRLVVVGAVHAAMPLLRYARELGFRTVLVDRRATFASVGADCRRRRGARRAGPMTPSRPSASTAATASPSSATTPSSTSRPSWPHSRAGARYVGAIGSPRRRPTGARGCSRRGLTEDELARLRGPIGLDLGGRAPAEVALAVMAEIVAERYGASGGPMPRQSQSPLGRPRPAMQFSGSVEIAAPREKVWEFVSDPMQMGRLRPRRRVGRDRRREQVHRRGQGRRRPDLRPASRARPSSSSASRPKRATVRARGKAPGNAADGTAQMTLRDGDAEGTTVMDWTADVSVGRAWSRSARGSSRARRTS